LRNCKDNSMADARSVQNAAQTFRAGRTYCSMNVLKIGNMGAAGTATLVKDLFIRFRSTLGFDHAFKSALNDLIGLAGVFHINLVQPALHFDNVFRMTLDVGCLALKSA
jgi:hypothetical protein